MVLFYLRKQPDLMGFSTETGETGKLLIIIRHFNDFFSECSSCPRLSGEKDDKSMKLEW